MRSVLHLVYSLHKYVYIVVYILECASRGCTYCIHDEVNQQWTDLPVRQNVQYYQEKDMRMDVSEPHAYHSIKKRDASVYRPIRIHLHFSELNVELNSNTEQLLRETISRTVRKISNILSVIPVSGPLLLSRSDASCRTLWQSGINAGKCSRIQPTYSGETCLDGFRIPPAHVDGLYRYNSTHPQPIQVMPPGSGVENSDYILYVAASSTPACLSEETVVIAYASYCQVDQKSRPIAGYANFCPAYLMDEHLDGEKLYMTALHELFHALGFSSKLFDDFRDNTLPGNPQRPQTVKTVLEGLRLITPKVVELTSQHFDCSTHQTVNEFGPLLDIKNGQITSHWDRTFMYSSLMTPTIGLPHLTVIDPITLAVFEDSGWYQVNYEESESFIWGKGEGCEFALAESCNGDTSSYFCSGRERGCHYLHVDKAECETESSVHGCHIFKPSEHSSCLTPPGFSSRLESVTYGPVEQCTPQSRCFVGNLTYSQSLRVPLEGHCFIHKCLGSELEVLIEENWISCPYGQTISVPRFQGALQCPPLGILCTNLIVPNESDVTQDIAEAEPEPEPEYEPGPKPKPKRPRKHKGDDVFIIEITFLGETHQYHWDHTHSTHFKDAVTDELCMRTEVARSRLRNIHVQARSGIVLSFALAPSLTPHDGPSSESVYVKLEELVGSGNFTVYVGDETQGALTAIAITRTEGGPEVARSSISAGAIAGIVIGSLFLAVLLGGLMLLLQRYYATRAHIVPRESNRPQRQAQNQEPGSSSSSATGTSNVSRSPPTEDYYYSSTGSVYSPSHTDISINPQDVVLEEHEVSMDFPEEPV